MYRKGVNSINEGEKKRDLGVGRQFACVCARVCLPFCLYVASTDGEKAKEMFTPIIIRHYHQF